MIMMMTMMMSSIQDAAAGHPVQTVASVDLQRYVGTWYEIGRYANRFQRKCVSDVTATYTLRKDGKVSVLNQCKRADGRVISAKGVAKIVDPASKAKLKVTFFWPFYGDYWIIGLDSEYRWAVVGHPARKYLWILSRTPVLSPEHEAQVAAVIQESGYEAARIMRTTHTSAAAH